MADNFEMEVYTDILIPLLFSPYAVSNTYFFKLQIRNYYQLQKLDRFAGSGEDNVYEERLFQESI